MGENNSNDDDLEEELEKAFKENEAKKNVFKILRDEKSAQDSKEKRIRKFKT